MSISLKYLVFGVCSALISSCYVGNDNEKDSLPANAQGDTDNIVIFSAGELGGGVGLAAMQTACDTAHNALSAKYKRENRAVFISTAARDLKDIPAPRNKAVITALNSGKSLATTWEGLWDGSIDNNISSTSNGEWWSGSQADGSDAFSAGVDRACNSGNWNNTSRSGRVGQLNISTSAWVASNEYVCSRTKHVLCLAY